jgi:hypothetical protein
MAGEARIKLKMINSKVLMLASVLACAAVTGCDSPGAGGQEAPHCLSYGQTLQVPLAPLPIAEGQSLVYLRVGEFANPQQKIARLEVYVIDDSGMRREAGEFALYPPGPSSRFVFDLNRFEKRREAWENMKIEVGLTGPPDDGMDYGVKTCFELTAE